MERSITEHNGAGFGEEYLFVSAPGAMGVFQLERIAKMAEDLDSVIEALSSAKLSLGKAVEQMTTGTARTLGKMVGAVLVATQADRALGRGRIFVPAVA